jgi:hypothetical protein
MFSQLQFMRLRAAEKALRDGRIDEAYRLASAPDLREHKRSVAVIASLGEKFLERAREHYRNDKFTEAMMDLDRAQAGGYAPAEVDELRGYVKVVSAEQQRQDVSRHRRIDAVQKRIERGSLAAGRDILEQAGEHDVEAKDLRRKVDERAGDASRNVEHAERLLKAGQLSEAAQRVRRARTIDAQSEAVAQIEARVCDAVLKNAANALREGNLHRASNELACLGDLGKSLPQRRELNELLAIAVEAGQCFSRHAYGEAKQKAMSLARKLPKARWVEKAVQDLSELEQLHTDLAAGPLADRVNIARSGIEQRKKPATKPASLDDTAGMPALGQQGRGHDKLLLLVDGGGSYLIVRSPQASIGRAASDTPADVPLFSDVAERHANVARVDDGYFIFSAKDIEVGRRMTKHELLRDGDRVVLGKKAKFTFRLPSRRSTTAVLDLSDTTKMPNDVRRVVLLDHHATIGSGSKAHITCRHLGPTLVLFERDGGLWIRAKSDGHVDTEAKPLNLGESIEIAGVSMVLQPWQAKAPGTRKV